MSTYAVPALVGSVRIVTGSNDKVYWRENKVGTADLEITLPGGPREVFHTDLAGEIAAAMTTESFSTGESIEYNGSFDLETGLYTITAVTPGSTFALKLSGAETQKLLTGGDSDTSGAAFYDGQRGPENCGFLVETTLPALAAAVSSDAMSGQFWTTTPIPGEPQAEPVARDPERTYQATVVQATALDGTAVTYDFSGWTLDRDDTTFPQGANLFELRPIEFDFMRRAERDQWIDQFWGPFAKAGRVFHYHADRTAPAAYTPAVLTGESLSTAWNHASRLQGYDFWSHRVEMRRAGVL